MEKSLETRLEEGARALHLALPPDAIPRLLAYLAELLKWNARVNLTAITEPAEAVEKHLLDSLAVTPDLQPLLTQPLPGTTGLLDLGAGAGLPGIPLAVALPDLTATLVDAVEKKVAFMKSGAVKAGVAPRVKALHARAEGRPDSERIPRAHMVIARAFMDLAPFLALARHYLVPGGYAVAMLGRTPPAADLERAGQGAGMGLFASRTFALPFSGDPRGVAVFHVKQEGASSPPTP
ncbi:MAG: 16S rRNA (guanine(527)-N(7))-methyltransferase RsmG [Myxococcota bacterium]